MVDVFTNTLNTDQATFLGFALEAIAYGTYTVLFFISITVLIWKTPTQNTSNAYLFAATCLMFSLCTVHFALNFNNVYNGLMVHPRPHISEETKLLAGADMLFSITDFCSQSILIYRCYVVWGRTLWIIIIPLLINLATIACGLALIGLVLSIDRAAPQAPEAIVPVGLAGYAMSLCLNFIISALIVGRIWYHFHQTRHILEANRSLKRASAIIVESGLLFLIAQFTFVVLFAIKHPAQAVLVPVATQIYGISPTLIIVRVSIGSSFEQTSVPKLSLRFHSVKRQSGTTRATTTMPVGESNLEMGPLQ
ncbi:hypothetical protein BDZ94DRAFT_1167831 [Collybia nuda]|uniref:Uncharacterized protein n=1 Tax=Collybia nuda TaxID=64659 RepID=A0A9P5Y4C6_9AGAR|nr:hypothetical protein BDZ94DRAFT_1167831 [Collybia nuda]